MGIDWDFLRSVVQKPESWTKEEFEEVYQNVAGVTQLKQRDKSLDKLQLLFTLSQAVMRAKWDQVKYLEAEMQTLAESAGRLDAHREKALLDEIDNLTRLLRSKQDAEDKESDLPYDWNKALKAKKQELEGKLINRNHEIDQLIVDLNNNEKEKQKLEQDVMDLQSELTRSTSTINKLASDLEQMKDRLTATHGALEEAEEMILSLKGENSELKALKAELEEKHREFTLQVDERVEKLGEVLSRKEKENENLKQQLKEKFSMRQQLLQDQPSTDEEPSIKEMIERKDQEIEILRQKLSEATAELDEKAAHFLAFKKDKSLTEATEANEVSKLRKELHQKDLQIKQLERQLTAAEDDAQLHAQDLATVLSELKTYMMGEFSLADAVAELKKVRRQVSVRDTQIKELTEELNGMQINANALYRENSELREQLSLEPKKDLDDSNGQKRDWKSSQKTIEKLTSEVLALQEEKISYRAKIYELTRTITELKMALESNPSRLLAGEFQDDQVGSLKNQINQLVSMVTELVQKWNSKRERSSEGTEFDEGQIEQQQQLTGPSSPMQTEEPSDLQKSDRRTETEKASSEEPLKPLQSFGTLEDVESLEKSEDHVYEKNLRKYHKVLKSLPPTAQETLTRLKSQVQFLLEEVSFKETKVQKGENDLANHRKRFEDLHAEITLLNSQLSNEREKWSEETESLKERTLELEAQKEALEAQLDELKKFLDEASTDVDETTKKIAFRCSEFKYEMELSRRMTCLHQRENELLREKLRSTQDTYGESLKKAKELENELIQERECHYQKQKAYLHRIDNSIPAVVNDVTAAELAAVTAKYRALLNEKEFQKKEKIELKQMEIQLKNLKKENDTLKENWAEEKQNVIVLQSSISLVAESQLDEQSKVNLLTKKIASAEVREMAAKQSASHAVRMFESCQSEKVEILTHLQEVEEANKKLLQENLTLQEKEIQLQTQVTTYTSRAQEKLAKEIEELRTAKDKMKLDVQKLQGLLEVSETQMRNYKLRYESAETEASQERIRNKDLASLGEDQLRLAILNFELAQAKIKNQELKAELDNARSNLDKSSLELSKTLFTMSENEAAFNRTLEYHKQRGIQLLLIIKDLRVQFTGAVPLPQQERLHQIIDDLVADKKELEQNLEKAKRDRREASLMLQEIKAKMENAEDVFSTLKAPSTPEQIVSEWSKKLEEVRLMNVRLKEEKFLLEEEKQLLKAHLKTKEERCFDLMEQLSRLERLWVEQQKNWEEQQICSGEVVIKESPIVRKEASTQKEYELKPILDTCEQENELLKQRLEVLENELHTKANEIQNLNDALNLRKPSEVVDSEEPDESTSLESKAPSDHDPRTPYFEVIIKGLKERLKIGEEALEDTQSHLKKTQAELREKKMEHERDIDYLNEERTRLEQKIRDLQFEINETPTRLSKAQSYSIQSLEIQRLHQTISTLEASLEKSSEKKRFLEDNLNRLEIELSECKRERVEERQQIEMSCEIKIQQMQREIDRLNKHIADIQGERDFMKKEVKTIQENVIRSPSLILKALVEKLRDQLIEKEKQISNMSQTLESLREKVIFQKESEDKDSFMKEEPVRDSDPAPSPIDRPNYNNLKAKIADLEAINSKLERKVKELSIMSDKQDEISNWKAKYDTTYSQKLKIERDLLASKKKNEELRLQLTEFREKEKNESEEMKRTREERQAKIEKSVMEWEVKKKLEMTVKALKDKISELENSYNILKSKYQTSRSLLDRCETEKLGLREKVTKLNKVVAENMCSICFRTTAVKKDLNRTYTIDCCEDGKDLNGGTYTIEKCEEGKEFNRTYTKEGIEEEKSQSPSAEKTKEDTKMEEEKQRQEDKYDKLTREKNQLEKRLKDFIKKFKEVEDENVSLKRSLSESLEEINALRKNIDRLNERLKSLGEQRGRSLRPSSAPYKRMSFPSSERKDSYQDGEKWGNGMRGAALILSYENKIESLEKELREKVRLQEHVKKVLEEALDKEQKLYKDKERLLQKIAILESVKDDTTEANLAAELRRAKVIINQLQRKIEAAEKPTEVAAPEV